MTLGRDERQTVSKTAPGFKYWVQQFKNGVKGDAKQSLISQKCKS